MPLGPTRASFRKGDKVFRQGLKFHLEEEIQNDNWLNRLQRSHVMEREGYNTPLSVRQNPTPNFRPTTPHSHIMPPSSLLDRLEEHLDQFMREHEGRDWLSQEELVRELFLSLAPEDDIWQYNARRCFIELVSLPTIDDLKEYALLQAMRRYAPATNGRFYKKNGALLPFEFLLSY